MRNSDFWGGGDGSRLTLEEAFSRYKHHLVPLALTPTLLFVATGVFEAGPLVVAPIFFAAALYAMWPCLRRNAPGSFWTIAGVVWMAGGIAAIVVLGTIQALTS